MEVVYLLHFSAPVRGSDHYIGRTGDLYTRLIQHRSGRGRGLTSMAVAAGVRLELAMVYFPTDGETAAHLERRLKHSDVRCPLCPTPQRYTFPTSLAVAYLDAEYL